MSETAPTDAPRPWTRWLDRGIWLAVAAFLLYRCVLPHGSGPPPVDVRVETRGQAVLVAFDGSR